VVLVYSPSWVLVAALARQDPRRRLQQVKHRPRWAADHADLGKWLAGAGWWASADQPWGGLRHQEHGSGASPVGPHGWPCLLLGLNRHHCGPFVDALAGPTKADTTALPSLSFCWRSGGLPSGCSPRCFVLGTIARAGLPIGIFWGVPAYRPELFSVASRPEIHNAPNFGAGHIAMKTACGVIFMAQGWTGPRDLLGASGLSGEAHDLQLRLRARHRPTAPRPAPLAGPSR